MKTNLNILIVDDEIEKATEISQHFTNSQENISCTHETTASAARVRLRQTHFDLLIIDLNLPASLGDGPCIEGGFELLDMLLVDEKAKIPSDILFITARDELLADAHIKALQRGVVLLEYSQKENWKNFINGRLKHLKQFSKQHNRITVDIAICTALGTPELDAVLELNYGWKTVRLPGDPTTYHIGNIVRPDRNLTVLVACAYRKGMPASAALATKIAIKFSPMYLVMLGICAGIQSKTNFGDIVIADPTWDYGSGKHAIDGYGSSVFLAAPVQFALDMQIKGLSERLCRDKELIQSIRNAWRYDLPAGNLAAIVGPMASGSSVIADDAESRKVALQQREVVALEMEAYAVMAAAEQAHIRKPIAIVIKSVCDHADQRKSDDWQKYAAFTSAKFADILFKHEEFSVTQDF